MLGGENVNTGEGTAATTDHFAIPPDNADLSEYVKLGIMTELGASAMASEYRAKWERPWECFITSAQHLPKHIHDPVARLQYIITHEDRCYYQQIKGAISVYEIFPICKGTIEESMGEIYKLRCKLKLPRAFELRLEIQELEREHKVLTAEILETRETLIKNLGAAQAELQNVSNELVSVKLDTEKLQTVSSEKVNKMQERVNKFSSSRDAKVAERDRLKELVRIAEAEAVKAREKAENAESEKSRLQSLIQEQQSTHVSVTAAMSKELTAATEKANSTSETIIKLNNELVELKLTSMKRALVHSEITRNHQERMGEVQVQTAVKDKQIQDLKGETSRLSANLQQLQSQKGEQPQRLLKRSERVASKQQQVAPPPTKTLPPTQQPSRCANPKASVATASSALSTPGKKQIPLQTKRWNSSPKINHAPAPTSSLSSVPNPGEFKCSGLTKPSVVKAAGKVPVKAAKPGAEVRGASSLPTKVVSGGPIVVTAKAPSSHGMVLRERKL
ncbi:hypothetical protein HDU76_001998 [Blyttiomyces sp. JEL0837]|nr:hypothetical protein HDU76_001998 [Blyttiomyces sp. JEL0837]